MSHQDLEEPKIMARLRESGSEGIIAAEEILGISSILKNCEANLSCSNERIMLNKLWSGEPHTSYLGPKPSVAIEKSGLCMAGFTNIENMYEVVQALGLSDDGLLDRRVNNAN